MPTITPTETTTCTLEYWSYVIYKDDCEKDGDYSWEHDTGSTLNFSNLRKKYDIKRGVCPCIGENCEEEQIERSNNAAGGINIIEGEGRIVYNVIENGFDGYGRQRYNCYESQKCYIYKTCDPDFNEEKFKTILASIFERQAGPDEIERYRELLLFLIRYYASVGKLGEGCNNPPCQQLNQIVHQAQEMARASTTYEQIPANREFSRSEACDCACDINACETPTGTCLTESAKIAIYKPDCYGDSDIIIGNPSRYCINEFGRMGQLFLGTEHFSTDNLDFNYPYKIAGSGICIYPAVGDSLAKRVEIPWPYVLDKSYTIECNIPETLTTDSFKDPADEVNPIIESELSCPTPTEVPFTPTPNTSTPANYTPTPFTETPPTETPSTETLATLTPTRTPETLTPETVTPFTVTLTALTFTATFESPTSTVESPTPTVESPTPTVESPTPTAETTTLTAETTTPTESIEQDYTPTETVSPTLTGVCYELESCFTFVKSYLIQNEDWLIDPQISVVDQQNMDIFQFLELLV